MLVRDVIERLQGLDLDAEVEAYIIPVPLFPIAEDEREEDRTSGEPKKPVRKEMKQGNWLEHLLRDGGKYIHHRVYGYKPHCILISDSDYEWIESYCRAINSTFDEGHRRLIGFLIKELEKRDQKQWKDLSWFR